MLHAFEWVLFGMLIWCCCIVLQAFQRRVAPESGDHRSAGKHRGRRRGKRAWHEDFGMGTGTGDKEAELNQEVERLRKRIETLEAIVTDPKYQWDQNLNS